MYWCDFQKCPWVQIEKRLKGDNFYVLPSKISTFRRDKIKKKMTHDAIARATIFSRFWTLKLLKKLKDLGFAFRKIGHNIFFRKHVCFRPQKNKHAPHFAQNFAGITSSTERNQTEPFDFFCSSENAFGRARMMARA